MSISPTLGPRCARCQGPAVPRPGGFLFCPACGPQDLEDLAALAYCRGLISKAQLAALAGMDEQAADRWARSRGVELPARQAPSEESTVPA
jgi:hypothetical protein